MIDNKLLIDGKQLTLDDISKILSKQYRTVEVSSDAQKCMIKSFSYVKEIVDVGKPVYGINTGFGALSNKNISKGDLSELQYNLIRSHCTGVGSPFKKKIVKIIMLIRANCLSRGFSGINPSIVNLICEFINKDIIPIVPEKGSVGASGDLAPLSHIALALIGEGQVYYKGKEVIASFAMEQENLKPATLGPKDGLSLINGTAVMASLQAVATISAKNLVKTADIISMLTLDGVKGTTRAHHPLITSLKPHLGQVQVVENLGKIIKDSEISKSHNDCDKVQDPYSLRCIPQVHGSSRQTIKQSEDVLKVELNSVTDNPLIFPDQKEVLSGGNFHGEALALAMDYLAMGVSEIASISERRVEKMMNPTFSYLPAFLIESSGLNSGLMIAHVTSAALASENKYLCHPASVDSIPTSTDKEDHVSMGVTSGVKLLKVIENTRYCLAIEALCASQAIDFQDPAKTSAPLQAVHRIIRKSVPKIEKDRVYNKDIEILANLIKNNELINECENLTGELK
jgi:histidine ammonia-lyase